MPLYLSEMSPVQFRGTLNIMFQLSITIGILVAQCINFGASLHPESSAKPPLLTCLMNLSCKACLLEALVMVAASTQLGTNTSTRVPLHLHGVHQNPYQIMHMSSLLRKWHTSWCKVCTEEQGMPCAGTQYMPGERGWRTSLWLAIVPAAVLFFGSLVLPETPNSLLERGHEAKARTILIRIRGTQNIDNELEDIRLAAQQSTQVRWCPSLFLLLYAKLYFTPCCTNPHPSSLYHHCSHQEPPQSDGAHIAYSLDVSN